MSAARFTVKVGARIVHGRREGRGPAVVLLHGSPNWSGAMQGVIDVLKNRFTAIALDTPGNGCSTPLAQTDPEARDYAVALGETLDALGLGRVALYGFHTGAGTAVELLKLQPHRITTVVCDGYAAFDDAERAKLLADYLPPLTIDWSGAHLAWLWSRCMEQTIFFPWHDTSAAARMHYTVPDAAALTASCLDFLRAGDHYRAPYAAAFKRRGIEGARDLPKPVLIGAMAPDPLSSHLQRLAPLAHGGEIVNFGTDRAAALLRMKDWLLRFPADEPPEAPAADGEGFAGDIFYRGSVPGGGRPLVLLHDAGGSSQLFDGVLKASHRPALALDLPGHGESGGTCPADVAGHADAIAAALSQLGVKGAAVAGIHLGGQVALDLVQRHPDVASRAALIGAPVYTDAERALFLQRYAPDLAPRLDGGHLLAAWHFARLRTLFFPWWETNGAHGVYGPPHLESATIHRQTVDLLKAGDAHVKAAYAAQFNFSTQRAFNSARAKLFSVAWDPLSRPERAALLGPAEALAPSPAAWRPALQAFAG